MKKFFNVLCNILWVIFIGIESVISCVIVGCVYCVTLIGIPFGLRYFKFIKLVFAPFGKKVETHFGKHGFLNVVWLIFGGIELFLVYGLIGIICFITIIGIPLGKQIFKISKYFLAPFGAEIVSASKDATDSKTEQNGNVAQLENKEQADGQTTALQVAQETKTYGKLAYMVLPKRIKTDPDKVMADGTSVKDYINGKQTTLEREKSLNKLASNSKMLLIFGIVITFILCWAILCINYINTLSNVHGLGNFPSFVVKLVESYNSSFFTKHELTPYLTIIGLFVVAVILLLISLIGGIKGIKKANRQKLALYNSNYADLVELYSATDFTEVKQEKTITETLIKAVNNI